MKTNYILISLLLFLSTLKTIAQDKKTLSLKEAISMVVANSNQANMADLKVATAKLEMENVKNNQYPSAKVSGEYLRLTNANIKSNIPMGAGLKVNELLLGQANVAMPIFSGFKIQNSIKASENLYKSETFSAAQTKEELALLVVEEFAGLYKSQEMVHLFEENLKTAQQRSKDFSAMVDNGVLAKNDLLKAQLQESNVQLSLDNAIKNVTIINYQLVTLLKLPENTIINIDIETIKSDMAKNQLLNSNGSRNDLEALNFKQKASEIGVEIAKGAYYPSLALTGGYLALNLKNTITVTNAMNIGVGFNYDLASIFKNKKDVALAKSKVDQTKEAVAILSDKIKEDTQQAQENYKLSVKQSQVYSKAVAQSDENYRIVKDKYDNSLSTTTDLLEADVQQLQSKINLALSQAEIALKYYQLQFAQGKLINSFNLSQK